MASCSSWSIKWTGCLEQRQRAFHHLMECRDLEYCVGVGDCTFLRFSKPWTFNEVYRLAMNFTGSDRGNCLHSLHYATDAQIASASATRANAQAVTADSVACGALPPAAVDPACLVRKFCHLLCADQVSALAQPRACGSHAMQRARQGSWFWGVCGQLR